MDNLQNKRISTETIKKIALLLDDHHKELKANYLQYKKESENYNDPINNEHKDFIVISKPNLNFSITIQGETEEREDVEWFVQTLQRNAKFIDKVHIYFFASLRKDCTNNNSFSGTVGEESFSLSFQPDYAYHNSSINNPTRDFDELLYKIKTLLNQAPAIYDATIKQKTKKENFPSLVIAMFGGIFLTLALGILFRVASFGLGFESFIASPYFAPIMFALTILVGLVIPGANHSLYNKLNIKKTYSRYNRNTREDVYEIDVKRMTNHCEVEIGPNADHGMIREKIEKNYSSAVKKFLILLGVFAVICVIFAFV